MRTSLDLNYLSTILPRRPLQEYVSRSSKSAKRILPLRIGPLSWELGIVDHGLDRFAS